MVPQTEADQLARYLSSQWSEETKRLLAAYEGGADAQLKESLVRDLNAVVGGLPIYDEDRFSRVELRPETRELLALEPEGEERKRLNRLLLHDAFPSELSRRTGRG